MSPRLLAEGRRGGIMVAMERFEIIIGDRLRREVMELQT
jgi:hypothetical protein